MREEDVADVLGRPLSQELLRRDLARLAFVAADGTPRVIPIGIFWNGAEVVMCTSTNARKLAALRQHPAVALTIDTEVHPPHVLLLRGVAVLDPVDGIPDEYLQMSGTYEMTAEQRAGFESEVRSLYVDGMVRIVVRPTWARLIDFETTLPVNVQELMDRRAASDRQGPAAAEG
ncbi:pyridoxamine 5'-phosphate oxidase family protein [Cellulomonas biazotea]|uniref:Pyridoxamine 5'-phosphate oxidase n=1 Tax=Cellulomonas biazotea TaxID=1709 RepID=A0A402DSK3_9CELL|nr:pyridoxamine 5'-phosphate oxidase family protein [Cellulomonas biazotea]GCE77102.1 pyridoxamine 5'-phosphate oxidase [Cellulomonas biazotea]